MTTLTTTEIDTLTERREAANNDLVYNMAVVLTTAEYGREIVALTKYYSGAKAIFDHEQFTFGTLTLENPFGEILETREM